MKALKFSVFVIIILGVLFYFLSEKITLKEQISVSAKLAPDEFVSDIEISGSTKLHTMQILDAQNKNELIKTYNNIQKIIAKSKICTSKNFSITPLNRYENGKKTQDGFDASLPINCTFKDENEFNEILNEIQKEVDLNENLLLSINNINAQISEAKKEETQSYLNEAFVKKALEKAEIYSKNLGQNCKIKEIEFLQRASFRENLVLAKSMDSMAKISMPSVKEVQSSVEGFVSFVCSLI